MLERMQAVIRRRREDERGFSLVELAVVIVIIGILVAIAVPVFISMQNSATDATNKANAANGSSMIAAAVAASSGGSIPVGTSTDPAGTNTAYAVLNQLKNNGTAVGATLTVTPTSATSINLTNYCVTVSGQKSGPAC